MNRIYKVLSCEDGHYLSINGDEFTSLKTFEDKGKALKYGAKLAKNYAKRHNLTVFFPQPYVIVARLRWHETV